MMGVVISGWSLGEMAAQVVVAVSPEGPLFPADAIFDALKNTNIPILHIGGDHDIIFPVENRYALNQQLPTVHLLTFPHAGHGPHHEHPQTCAEHIATFVRTTS